MNSLDKKCANCANNVLPSNCPACMECNNEDRHVPALDKTEEEQMREVFETHTPFKLQLQRDISGQYINERVRIAWASYCAGTTHANSKHSAILEDYERAAKQEIARLDAAGETAEHEFARQCEWVLDDEDWNSYTTSCGHEFLITDGTPEENNMKFCVYCGGELIVQNLPESKP